MKVSGPGREKMPRDMEEESRFGKMEVSMRANGKTTRQTEKEDSSIKMETSMKENGVTIKLQVKESIPTQTALTTQETGSMINNTDMARKFGQMELSTQAITLKERRMAQVVLNGQMAQITTETLRITIFTVKESTAGQMEEDSRETGSTTRCTEEENSRGKMVGNTKESTLRIRRKDRVFSHGLMEECMTANGIKASNTASDTTLIKKAK